MKRLALSAIIIALSIVASLTSAGERNTKYFAFVGEKISIKPVSPESGDTQIDYEFIVKYRVLESVYGAFDGEVIEFTVFDHYGAPRFSEHRHALLYVQNHDGKYYHSKYMYSPIYQTAEGRWTGPYYCIYRDCASNGSCKPSYENNIVCESLKPGISKEELFFHLGMPESVNGSVYVFTGGGAEPRIKAIIEEGQVRDLQCRT